jgi:molecular chaperone GrpE
MNTEERRAQQDAAPCGETGPVETTESSRRTTEEELQSAIDRLQRLQAEFENYKKRSLRDASLHEERITDRVILEFLPLYENMQRAFRSLAANRDMETFVDGMEQIFAQFRQVLESNGIEEIETVQQPFDPARHEALLSVPSELEKNRIVEEFAPGYTRDKRVLRPSKVSVSRGDACCEEETI